ncbi:MAG: hypothetical protein AAB429_00555, partial [Patescibacteria group bacterium]
AARKRITNAVTGLVLLLFAYLVLNTVNPALVKFKVLQLPLIKPSLFLTGSCESFKEKGYTIDPDPGAANTDCGDKGEITKDPSGASLSSTDCTFNSCGSSGQMCGKVGTEYKCMTCENAGSPEFLDAGFVASPAHCSSLSPVATATRKDRCVYSGAVGILEGAFTSYSIGQKFCSEVKVDCGSISSCADYVIGAAGQSSGFFAGGSPYNPFFINSDEYEAMAIEVNKKLCEDDPCGVAKIPFVCIFDPSTESENSHWIYSFSCK